MPQLGVRQRRGRRTPEGRWTHARATGPVVPYSPQRQVTEARPEYRRRPSPVARDVPLGVQPTMQELTGAIRSLSNGKAVGLDGVHRHIQRRNSGSGVQPNERVLIPRGECQPQCRPVQLRSTGAYATHGAASGVTPSNCETDRALPLSSQSGC